MTFVNKLARGLTFGAAAALLTIGVSSAQNGTNYDVLHNDAEAAFVGLGAGAGQIGGVDGMGTFVPGENMRGSHQVDFGALGVQFSYRNNRFREAACIFTPGAVNNNLKWPGIVFVELDGESGAGTTLHGNSQPIFLTPVCALGLGSFVPYGTGPATSQSWVVFGVASAGALGLPSNVGILTPEHGVLASGGGSATLVAVAGSVEVGLPAGSGAFGCWLVQFTWTPSSVPYLDNIDGMWHYQISSPDNNQYYLMSSDEMNIWQSQSVFTDGGIATANALLPQADYAYHLATPEPQTTAALAPHGAAQGGPYYAQTESVVGGGPPNFGFDVGRSQHAISFSGTGGVSQMNQDPANGPGGTTPTLSFATWDNGGDGDGSRRLFWGAIDDPQINIPVFVAENPDVDPGVSVNILNGPFRLPVHAGGFIAPETGLAQLFFGHTTASGASGWPDPHGITTGAFGVPPIGGGTAGFLTVGFVGSIPCGVGIPVNFTYGSSGLTDAGGITFDPDVADISYSKEIYLWK